MRHPPGCRERGRGHLTTLYKGGRPVEDSWTLASDDALPLNGVPVILTLKQWTDGRDALSGRNQPLGIRIEPGETLDAILPDLGRFSLVALSFPKFTDGRSFSKAKMLRDEHGFSGEIRAVGEVLWDQLQLMARCGFDAFEISHEPTLQALEKGKKPFMTDFYQPGLTPEAKLSTPRAWARRAVNTAEA